MPAITTNDLKNGITLQLDNGLFQVIEFQHVKPGKGGAFVRTKLRNVRTGSVLEKTFNAGIRVEQAIVDRQDMQFLYRDGDDYVFMNTSTYDQLHVDPAKLGDAAGYLVEQAVAQIAQHDGEIIGVEIPASVELAGRASPSRACRATGCPGRASRPSWRRARSSRCRCSSTSATGCGSTRGPASTSLASMSERASDPTARFGHGRSGDGRAHHGRCSSDRQRTRAAGPASGSSLRRPRAGPVPAVRGRPEGRARRGRARRSGGARRRADHAARHAASPPSASASTAPSPAARRGLVARPHADPRPGRAPPRRLRAGRASRRAGRRRHRRGGRAGQAVLHRQQRALRQRRARRAGRRPPQRRRGLRAWRDAAVAGELGRPTASPTDRVGRGRHGAGAHGRRPGAGRASPPSGGGSATTSRRICLTLVLVGVGAFAALFGVARGAQPARLRHLVVRHGDLRPGDLAGVAWRPDVHDACAASTSGATTSTRSSTCSRRSTGSAPARRSCTSCRTRCSASARSRCT